MTNKKDPATAEDVIDEIDHIIPTRVNCKHRWDTPRDAAGHIKASIVGVDLVCPVIKGRLALGQAQGVFFCEFDGPRKRKFSIYFIEDAVIQEESGYLPVGTT